MYPLEFQKEPFKKIKYKPIQVTDSLRFQDHNFLQNSGNTINSSHFPDLSYIPATAVII